MEFLHTQSRYNGPSSLSQFSSGYFLRKNVGLSIFYDIKPAKEAPHIVFKTRNLTESLTKSSNDTSSNIGASKDKSTLGKRPNPLIKPCLLSCHGLGRDGGDPTSLEPERLGHTTPHLLPLTVCAKHGKAGFLPLDYVRRLPEYTRTTHNYPIFKVVHSFEDCILEFPYPPPIGSSEEHLFRHDYLNKCYQCYKRLSHRKTAYMYRDYLFCCPGCRLKACAAHYWYKKAMAADDEETIDDGILISTTMER